VISCAELDQFIVDYLERNLRFGQRAHFRFHLLICPKCRAYLDSYKKTIALGKKAFADPERPASEAAPPELIRAILASRQK
jgi:hypothetical protein